MGLVTEREQSGARWDVHPRWRSGSADETSLDRDFTALDG
jgi:hypothetical protein